MRNGAWRIVKALSQKRYVEEHGLLEHQNAQIRYRNIVNKYLEEKDTLLNELVSWRRTEDFQLFWLARKRRKTELVCQNGAAEYFCKAVAKEVNTMCGDSSSIASSEEGSEELDGNENVT